MGPIGCPETSVHNYHFTLRNIPEERRSHLHRGGSILVGKFILLFMVSITRCFAIYVVYCHRYQIVASVFGGVDLVKVYIFFEGLLTLQLSP